MLQEDLKQKTKLLDSKESAIGALEERLSGKARSLESQLQQKQELLAARDAELDALMAKVSELSQKVSEMGAERERSDRLLQEELREKTLLLQSSEKSVAESEEHLQNRLDVLERQVAEKHKLLESSGLELRELRAQFNDLTERFNETEAAKVALEGLLQQERSNADKALAVVEEKGAEAGFNGEAGGLETLLSEREQLLQARDKLIENLMTELRDKKTQLARQEIEVWQKIERREAWKHRLSKIGIRMKD
jgi:chromosome segregation ATPase